MTFEQFSNTVRLSEAFEDIIKLVEVENEDNLDLEVLLMKLRDIIDDYKRCSLTDDEYEFLSEEWGDD